MYISERMKTKLSVNINKVALIRNARGGNLPDLLKFAKDCELYGADGITVHPRPDQRHIRYDDLSRLRQVNTTEFNIEGYPSETFLNHVLDVQPHQCTLVPDPPGVLTSDKGWDIDKDHLLLSSVISRLQEKAIRVSLFVDAELEQIEAARDVGADRIELYTGDYARMYPIDRAAAIFSHVACSQKAKDVGLGVNAGHDLNLINLKFYAESLPFLDEVSIGHALISDALYYGISNSIGMYLKLLG